MDQLTIPQLIFFFILITCQHDVALILLGEILSHNHAQFSGKISMAYNAAL